MEQEELVPQANKIMISQPGQHLKLQYISLLIK